MVTRWFANGLINGYWSMREKENLDGKRVQRFELTAVSNYQAVITTVIVGLKIKRKHRKFQSG